LTRQKIMPRLLRVKLPLVDAPSEAWQALWGRQVESCRPERHSMRGPRPKARARRQV
jgi:hypothetical protein